MSTYEELYVGFCSDVNGGGNPPGIHTTASFDGEACRGECSSYSTCTGYNFLPSGGGCFLWEVSDAPSGWTQMNPSSGWTTSSSIGGTHSTHHGTSYYGQCYRKQVGDLFFPILAGISCASKTGSQLLSNMSFFNVRKLKVKYSFLYVK